MNGTVKVFFYFPPALLRFIILLKIAAKYLPMSGPKVVSVFPALMNRGGKIVFLYFQK
jgi:hypothetical protein